MTCGSTEGCFGRGARSPRVVEINLDRKNADDARNVQIIFRAPIFSKA